MDYCIKNSKNIYIRIGKSGQPITCGNSLKGRFEESKAKNIISNLPLSLRRMNFKVVAIPDIKPRDNSKEEPKVIQNDIYI